MGFFQFQGSRIGLFSNLSMSRYAGLRIPLDKPLGRERLDMSSSTCLGAERLGAAGSPTDKLRKDSTLRLGRARCGPPVTSKKPIVLHKMTKIVSFFKALAFFIMREEYMKKILYGTFFLITWIIVTLTAGFAQQFPGPKMVLNEKYFNAQSVKEGQIIEHTFTVFNKGDRPLEIKKVQPG
jgi:hypothetical protein